LAYVKNLNPILSTSLSIFAFIILLLLSVFVSASGIVAIGKIIKGDELSVRMTFQSAWKIYWKFFVVVFLTSLIILGGSVAILVVGNLVGSLLSIGLGLTSGILNTVINIIGILLEAGTVVSLIAFIFVFTVRLAFSRFVFIDENLGIKASLTESMNLVKGKYWAILGRLLVFGVISWIIRIILSQIPYGIGLVVMILCGGLFILPTYLLYKEISA